MHFDKPSCQNIRKSLRKEWIETDGLGNYSSSTLLCCNTRKYHGLFVVDLDNPCGKYVLLSTLEESLRVNNKEFFISCRKHPGIYYPRGHEYLESVDCGSWPIFNYRFGDLKLEKEVLLIKSKGILIVRYHLKALPKDVPDIVLRIRPLLAFRNIHDLTCCNDVLNSSIKDIASGISIKPYEALPELFMHIQGATYIFQNEYSWCQNVEYMVEAERGFPNCEDLFQPGYFDIKVNGEKEVYFVVTIDDSFKFSASGKNLEKLWNDEVNSRRKTEKTANNIIGNLVKEGDRFLVESKGIGTIVIAGYHWFGAWGRDTFIALPGLTFYSNRIEQGKDMLANLGKTAKNGLIPNCFSLDGNHAYNSVDSSLWYIWSVQQLLKAQPDSLNFIYENCWDVIQSIVNNYLKGAGGLLHFDDEGFFSVGDEYTQLTWMDANADGKPVTPRHGQPVEISALWYNALAFIDYLSGKFNDSHWNFSDQLKRMRTVFEYRYWITDVRGDYLADVWRDGVVDRNVRPNQLFAVSLPYPILVDEKFPEVVSRAQRCLLTPYGLRTLAPSSALYKPLYEGGPSHRDSAYHQGSVWPWLLGAYVDALLATVWEPAEAVRQLLMLLTPLYSKHMEEAGLGSISEIFDGDPPHLPNGCIAQAWSVAESIRSLHRLRESAPEEYDKWEKSIIEGAF